MRRMSAVKIFLIGAVLLLIVGSSGWELLVQSQAPHDLKLVSVSTIKYSEIKGTDFKPSPDWLLLKVTLASRVDLQSYSRRYGVHIFYWASPCENGHVNKGKNFWSVMAYRIYDDIGHVELWSWSFPNDRYRTEPSGKRTASGEIPYYIYIGTSYDGKNGSTIDHFSYDFESQPVDICVLVRGSGGAGYEFDFTPWQSWSNTVVIPKQMVANAVAHAHMK